MCACAHKLLAVDVPLCRLVVRYLYVLCDMSPWD